ncbi:MAG: hypothetical protein ACXQTU_02775 [Candidatus Nezhaarchaeales archaeon]
MSIMNENYWYPCCTLIIGFPDETEDDMIKTLELVDDLRSMKAKAWPFPLFMIPMGGSLLSNEKFFDLRNLSRLGWELIHACWSHSINFTREMVNHLLSPISNRYIKLLALRLAEISLSTLERTLDSLKTSPQKALRELAQYNIRANFLSYIPKMLSSVIVKKP